MLMYAGYPGSSSQRRDYRIATVAHGNGLVDLAIETRADHGFTDKALPRL